MLIKPGDIVVLLCFHTTSPCQSIVRFTLFFLTCDMMTVISHPLTAVVFLSSHNILLYAIVTDIVAHICCDWPVLSKPAVLTSKSLCFHHGYHIHISGYFIRHSEVQYTWSIIYVHLILTKTQMMLVWPVRYVSPHDCNRNQLSSDLFSGDGSVEFKQYLSVLVPAYVYGTKQTSDQVPWGIIKMLRAQCGTFTCLALRKFTCYKA